jgi:hypothetical protein
LKAGFEALRKKFPRANFTKYFSFIRKHAGKGKGLQNHHIAPRSQFPDLKKEPGNLVKLTFKHHRTAHIILSEAVPACDSFRNAMYYLTGQSEKAFLANARKGGHIAGLMNVKSGHLKRILGLGGIKGGVTAGRRAAESGFLTSIRTKETCRKGGLRGGRANVKSGQAFYLGYVWGPIAGIISGRKLVESGHVARMGPKGRHVRWHVNRNIKNTDCTLCYPKRKSNAHC